ncbi:hypothetical protein D3C74_50510 [compost metagenome]
MEEELVVIKIYMTSGTILYRKDKSLQAFRAYVNSSNARGANVITGFKDSAVTQEVQMVLSNVEYFEKA